MTEKERKQKKKKQKIREPGLSGVCFLFDQLHTLHSSQQWLTIGVQWLAHI